ncbi:MAG: divalent-cation tolerance protein CutA [Legionellales bacterium]|nr:divalent-cation tolerance protein CutA [Legionellales bacterium]|tara:strand:+ start:70 stop:396 length:327 start_codon:yes stop_codon:yes gene_type:complete
MIDSKRPILVLSTFPESASVKDIAECLVNEKLAACVNIVSGVHSIFNWQNKMDNANEIICIIKTTNNLYSKLEKRIIELHPYELPEIISVSIENGLPSYLDWISENTK